MTSRWPLTSTAHSPTRAHRRPDFVVLDLNLDGANGLASITPLIEINAAVRIVVLTGYASIATAVEAIKLGAAHYLIKPANADEILDAFETQAGAPGSTIATTPTPLDRLQWEHIQKTLAQCDGNISVAAKRLGLHRRTLQRKLQKRPSGLA